MVKKNKTIKILHFDADEIFLYTSKEILQTFGNFEIDVVTNVSEADEALRQRQYDVIVCGYNVDRLGLTNGLDFFMKLRAEGNMTPFIMFTVHDEIKEEALKSGISKFIDKNINCETVYTRLSNSIKELVMLTK